MHHPRHIGLFGGTFNPVHSGHLLATEAVFKQLALDEIRFIPAARSPFKDRPALGDAHRVAMLERAIADYPGFVIDPRELSRSGPSYTIDTLKSIVADSPGNRLYLLIGMDAWQNFELWHEWQAIAELCHLVVMTRPGYSPTTLSGYWQARQVIDVNDLRDSSTGKLIFFPVPVSDAASSEIRRRIERGQSTENCLSNKVREYIEEQQLYR